MNNHPYFRPGPWNGPPNLRPNRPFLGTQIPPNDYQYQQIRSRHEYHQRPVFRPRHQQPRQFDDLGHARFANNNFTGNRYSYDASNTPNSFVSLNASQFHPNTSDSKQKTPAEGPDHNDIVDWLKNRLICSDNGSKRISSPQVAQLKILLRQALFLLDQLKSIKSKFNGAAKVSDEEMQTLLAKATNLKGDLLEVQCKVNELTNAAVLLRKKAKRIRHKRARLRRKRARTYEERQKQGERCKEKHAEIDNWQEEIQEKIQEQKMENELKAIADKTLEEVRRKVNDTKRGLDTLSSISKLRKARVEGLQQTGLFVSKESDIVFKQRHEELEKLLRKQLTTYKNEQRLLQVMLDTEKAELREHDEEERKRVKEEKEEAIERKLRRILFGPPVDYQLGHPLYPFHLFYSSASLSSHEFLRIRREWDSYLVTEDSNTGSLIPAGWVLPAPPSSEEWASALVMKAEPK